MRANKQLDDCVAQYLHHNNKMIQTTARTESDWSPMDIREYIAFFVYPVLMSY